MMAILNGRGRTAMWTAIAAMAAITSVAVRSADPQAILQPAVFTTDQAARGKLAFDQSCASCHGAHLNDGALGKPLKGPSFVQKFGSQGLDHLFMVMSKTMPQQAPGSLDAKTYADILAYILQANAVTAGKVELPSDPARLAKATIPAQEFMGFSPYAPALPKQRAADPFARWTKVSARLLADPPAGDWLSWRRTYDVHSFSPLKQIDRANVGKLQVAWSWSLPPGPALAAPLVHDGVMFVAGSCDCIDALDAKTGDALWQYVRTDGPSGPQPNGAAFSLKRGMALYGDRLYFATADTHVLALDIRTGAVIWDQLVGDAKARESITGGPIVAEGKVVVGTTGTGVGAKTPEIVGLDAESGAIAWRLSTIAEQGAPGGDSWNGVPFAKRSGASVWMPGSFDPDLGLVYFGTGNTYDTGPLLHPIGQPGVTNDALYTDSTLAIDPATGKLAWHFQHMPNDQWDLDWAFEQQLIRMPIKGKMRNVVLTAGKAAIYDGVDAKTANICFRSTWACRTSCDRSIPRRGRRISIPTCCPARR